MEIDEAVERGINKLAELNLSGHFPSHMRDDIYHKPNAFPQSCYICREELKKGGLIRKEQSGATKRGYLTYTYAHLDCFLALLFHTIVDGGS